MTKTPGDATQIACRAADVAFGGLLVYSGFAKSVDPQLAITGIERATGLESMGDWVLLTTVASEVVFGVSLALLGGRSLRAIAVGLLGVFTGYLLLLRWNAPGTPCGCAGSSGVPGVAEFVRNGLLLAGAAMLFVASPANVSKQERSA